MKFNSSQLLVPVFTLGLLLSGCGGGGGDFQNDPRASGRAASVNVSGATDTSLNGLYATNDVFLDDVEKVNPIGGEPETCRSRFSNLPKAGTAQIMDGEIRYIPGTTEARVTVVSISTIEFRLLGSTGAVVDRANNVMNLNNAVFTSTQVAGRSITMNGSIPIRAENKPEGC